MAYEKRMSALKIGEDDDKKKKKKVVYQEKGGKRHKTKEAFYASTKERDESDGVMYKTSDGMKWSTKAEYNAHKKGLESKTPYKRKN